ncbi:hypothetical protein AB0I69_42690 [Streptomyces sp. NPDC050508]|uniref:hypothetical protein n=1 Tax=Streptomyces sp. NPDC050508 TaxID=3155405 RepID=UPI0034455527
MDQPTDFIGEIHTWLVKYQVLAARHAEALAPYLTEDGEPDVRKYGQYDEQRFDNTIEADNFLDSLVLHLHDLAGPPVPGDTFTLTFAGPERHDGEQPYAFVLNGADIDDARRQLLDLPFFREWFAEQAGWDDTPPDVLYVADQSHPGLPEWGAYNDLRREQAAAVPAEIPALPA